MSDIIADGALNPALALTLDGGDDGQQRKCFMVDSFLFTDAFGARVPVDMAGAIGSGVVLNGAVKGLTQRVAFPARGWQTKTQAHSQQQQQLLGATATVVVRGEKADYWLLDPHPDYRSLYAVFRRKAHIVDAVALAFSHGATTWQAVYDALGVTLEELVGFADFVLQHSRPVPGFAASDFCAQLQARSDAVTREYVVPDDAKHKRLCCHVCKRVPRYTPPAAPVAPPSADAAAASLASAIAAVTTSAAEKAFRNERLGKCSRCSRHFCRACLAQLFGESLRELKRSGTLCPVCRELCFCEACRKRADGELHPSARALAAAGFDVVPPKGKSKKRSRKEKGKEKDAGEEEEEDQEGGHKHDHHKHSHHKHHPHKHHHHHHHEHEGEEAAEPGSDSEEDKEKPKKKKKKQQQKTLEEFILDKGTTDKLRKEIAALSRVQRIARLEAETDLQKKRVISSLIANLKRSEDAAVAREEKKHEKLKFPIDDVEEEEFAAKRAKRKGESLPPWPAPNKLVSPAAAEVGDIMLIWQFLVGFRTFFTNAKIGSIGDVVKMLSKNPPSHLCEAAETIHADLLQAVLSQEEAKKAREEDRDSEDPDVDTLSCWEVLRTRLVQSPNGEHNELAKQLAEHDYFELDMPAKTAILSYLCEEFMRFGQFRGSVEEGLGQLAEARAELKDLKLRSALTKLNREETPQPESAAAQRRRELKEQRETKAQQTQLQRLETREANAAAKVRVDLLGFDRHNRMYWFYGRRGVLVHDGTKEGWFLYATKERFDELRSWLTERGMREKALLKELEDISEGVCASFEALRAEFEFEGGASDPIDLSSFAAAGADGGSTGPSAKDRVQPVATMLASLAETMPEKALKDKEFARAAFAEKANAAASVAELVAVALDLEENTDPETLDDPGWKDNSEAWRESVRQAKTPAALAVAVLAYDTVCPWSPRCRICKKRLHDQRFVQCAHCNRCYHLGCLRPPMHRAPTSDWFCPSCKSVEEELLSKSNEKCDICGRGGKMLCCDSCPRVFHLACLGMYRLPRGEWHCEHCRPSVAAAASPFVYEDALPARSAKTRGREMTRRMAEDDDNDAAYLGADAETPKALSERRRRRAQEDDDSHGADEYEPPTAEEVDEEEGMDVDDDDGGASMSDSSSSSSSSPSSGDDDEDDEPFRSKAEQAQHDRAQRRKLRATKQKKRHPPPAPNMSRMGLRERKPPRATSSDLDDADAEAANRARLGLRATRRVRY